MVLRIRNLAFSRELTALFRRPSFDPGPDNEQGRMVPSDLACVEEEGN
jgi:hypothetical protein